MQLTGLRAPLSTVLPWGIENHAVSAIRSSARQLSREPLGGTERVVDGF
jgi:hypothetical protein